jgi:hypothetical protein
MRGCKAKHVHQKRVGVATPRPCVCPITLRTSSDHGQIPNIVNGSRSVAHTPVTQPKQPAFHNCAPDHCPHLLQVVNLVLTILHRVIGLPSLCLWALHYCLGRAPLIVLFLRSRTVPETPIRQPHWERKNAAALEIMPPRFTYVRTKQHVMRCLPK